MCVICQLTSIFCEQKPGVDLVPLSILAAQSAILSMADQQSRLILSCFTESAMARLGDWSSDSGRLYSSAGSSSAHRTAQHHTTPHHHTTLQTRQTFWSRGTQLYILSLSQWGPARRLRVLDHLPLTSSNSVSLSATSLSSDKTPTSSPPLGLSSLPP